MGGHLEDETLLRRIIAHELTHAFVFELAKGRAPTWLNEGLAQFFEGDAERIVPPETLVPLNALHGSFLALDRTAARRAYAESLSATAYLVDRYGLFRVRLLLAALGTNRPFADAFADVLLISYAEFESDWRRRVTEGAEDHSPLTGLAPSSWNKPETVVVGDL